MNQLQRAYQHVVLNNNNLILETTEDGVSDEDIGMKPMSGEELKSSRILPRELLPFVLTGSAKQRLAEDVDSTWAIEVTLKLPKKEWTDGTEDIDTTYEYVERHIRSELPEAGGVPGYSYVRSSAVVNHDLTDENFIFVRCYVYGGMDI